MLLAGIIGYEGKSKTASLINSILTPAGKKVSIIDSGNLIDLGYKRTKDYIFEVDKNNTDILILKINIPDIEKEIFDYLHFDIIIYTGKADDLKWTDKSSNSYLMQRILSVMDEKGILIVNIDDVELIHFFQGMKYDVISYGFNSKASITTSSVGDIVFKDDFMCCQQRTISTKNGRLIEPQEYKIKLEPSGLDAYNVLAAATFAIVNGVDLNYSSLK